MSDNSFPFNDTYYLNTIDTYYNTTVRMYDNSTIEPYGNSTAYNNSTAPDNPFPKNMLAFTSICAFIIAILGTIGNIITILALLMAKKLRTPTTAYVINLAVAELMFCLIILPISGAQYLYLQLYAKSWLNDSECIYFAVIRYTLTQAELQTIVAIALTRAIAVGSPRFYQRINTKIATCIYITCIWIYSFALKLPTGIGVFGSYNFNHKTMECDMANDMMSQLSRKVSLFLEFLIPVLTVFILYIYIFVKVRKSSLRVSKAARTAAVSRSSGGQPLPSDDDSTEKRPKYTFKILKRKFSDNSMKLRFTRRSSSVTSSTGTNRRDIRLARTIFTIFFVILLCSVPVGVIHLIDNNAEDRVRFLGVHILYWIQYCLNMIIYVIMNRQYRDAYVELFAKIMPACKKHEGFIFPWESPSMASSKPPTLGLTGGSFKRGSVKRKSWESDNEADQRKYGEALIQERLPAIQEVTNSSTYKDSDIIENITDNQIDDAPEVNDSDDSENDKQENLLNTTKEDKLTDKMKQTTFLNDNEQEKFLNKDECMKM